MIDVKKSARLLIDKRSVAFIASLDADGFPNIKAMLAPRKIVGMKKFYFITSTSSMRVAQYMENPKAAIYFFNKQLFIGLMLKGKMNVLEDEKSKNMLWIDTDIQYYKGGAPIQITVYSGSPQTQGVCISNSSLSILPSDER